MALEDFARAVFDTLDDGLFQTMYRASSVPVDEVLRDLRNQGIEISDLDAVRTIGVERLDPVVDRYIRSSKRSAAMSGASLGAGGWVSLPPGLCHLVMLILRLAQRISVTYGFDYRTDRGEIELWKALASAVGAKVDWEGTEAELMRRLPAVVTGTGTFANPLLLKAFHAVVLRIAATGGLRITRWVPIVGGGTGMLLNYLEVARVGQGLKESWRNQHLISRFDPSEAREVEVLR